MSKTYGLIKKINKNNIVLLTNRGKIVSHKSSNTFKINDRVCYTWKNGKIQNFKIINTEEEYGRIVQHIPGGGLIRTDLDEMLSYTDPDKMYMIGQRVLCRISVTEDEELKFPIAEIIKLIPEKTLSGNLLKTAKEKLLSELGCGDHSVEDVLNSLKDSGIPTYLYDNYELLDEFSDILYLKENAVHIFDIRGHEEEIEFARNFIEQAGFKSFTRLQEKAVHNEQFWSNNRVLAMGTTSSGKTLIPIIKFLYCRQKDSRLKLLFVVPYRALAYQMYVKFTDLLKGCNFDIACSTSEKTERDVDIVNGDVDIAIVIYEKLFIFNSENPGIFNTYGFTVFDEVGLIEEKERGVKAEMILIKSLSEKRTQTVMLATPYINWNKYIDAYNICAIRSYNRPVRINEFFFKGNTGKKNNTSYDMYDHKNCLIEKGTAGSFAVTLSWVCSNEYSLGNKTLVFVFSKKVARSRATDIYRTLKKRFGWLTPGADQLKAFKNRFLKKYGLQQEELKGIFEEDIEYEALMHGITFHTASLPESMRIAIESEFLEEPSEIENGLKIVVATETLAFGLNSNVDTVVMTHIKKSQMGYEEEVISYNLYQNCIGRAGRLSYIGSGKSYTFLSSDVEIKDFSWDPSFSGDDIKGKFSGIIKTPKANKLAFCILNIFNNKEALSEEEMTDRLSGPLFSSNNKKKLAKVVKEAVEMLLNEKMLEPAASGFFDEDEDDNDDKSKYALTKKSRDLRGYMISMDSYHILDKALKELLINGESYTGEFMLEMCSCGEIMQFCSNMLKSPMPYSDEDYMTEISDLRVFVNILNSDALSRVFDSPYFKSVRLKIKGSECYKNAEFITEHEDEFDDVSQIYNELLKIDYKQLNIYMVAVYAILWISGYSISLIYDIAGDISQPVDNVRSKFGEKLSYLLDVASNFYYEPANGIEDSFFKQYSVSALYGIRSDWLREDNITELTPDRARTYYLASIISRRQECEKTEADNENLTDEIISIIERKKK